MTGDVEITLPKMPEPIPPTGFALTGYKVGFDGMNADESHIEKSLQAAKLDVELKLSGRFTVYAFCKDIRDEMVCEWKSFAGCWGAWEYA